MLVSIILLAVLGADGGVDAGIPDAGLADARPARWNWIDGDGGWLLDGGLTDILTLRVGETAHIVFPLPIVLMQCDEPLLGLGATEDTLLLTGLQPGHTACGFWFDKRAWPHRSFDVTVSK
jgi:hypothetical protein